MQLCQIHLYQKIARKKVARVNAALSRFFVVSVHLKIPGVCRQNIEAIWAAHNAVYRSE